MNRENLQSYVLGVGPANQRHGDDQRMKHALTGRLACTALTNLTLAVTSCGTAPSEPGPSGLLVISPSHVVVLPDAEVQFSATVTDTGGAVVDGTEYIWQSSDTTVATIDASGLAIAKQLGVTEISAISDVTPSTVTTFQVITPTIIAGTTHTPGTSHNDSGVPFASGVSIDVNGDGRDDFDLHFVSNLANNADVISWIDPKACNQANFSPSYKTVADSIIDAHNANDLRVDAWADIVRAGVLIDGARAWTSAPVTLSYFYKRDALMWSHTFGLWAGSDPEPRFLALRMCDGAMPSAQDTYGWAAFSAQGLVFAGKAPRIVP